LPEFEDLVYKILEVSDSIGYIREVFYRISRKFEAGAGVLKNTSTQQ